MSISRIYRLLRLITLLQTRRGYSANELASELEVSRRTVFRDLNMLEMARIPYYFDEETRGYRISRHFFLPPINLTVGEALAMLVLTGGMGQSHLPLLSAGRQAAAKLENALPSPIREQVGGVLENLSISLGPVSRHDGLDGLFDQLSQAISTRRVCRMTYQSFHEGEAIETEVHPLRLAFRGRAWYLVAHSVTHGEIRTFKVVRVRDLMVGRERFERPDEGLVADHFGQAWDMIRSGRIHDVHLRFGTMVAGNVAEVQWHATQQLDWNDDGTLDFRVRIDGLREIVWWILGYGDQVEVLSPPELRQEVLARAEAMVQRYSGRAGQS